MILDCHSNPEGKHSGGGASGIWSLCLLTECRQLMLSVSSSTEEGCWECSASCHMLRVSVIVHMLSYDFEILGGQVGEKWAQCLMWSLCWVIQTLPCEQRNGENVTWLVDLLVKTWGSRRVLAGRQAAEELTDSVVMVHTSAFGFSDKEWMTRKTFSYP